MLSAYANKKYILLTKILKFFQPPLKGASWRQKSMGYFQVIINAQSEYDRTPLLHYWLPEQFIEVFLNLKYDYKKKAHILWKNNDEHIFLCFVNYINILIIFIGIYRSDGCNVLLEKDF